MASGKINGTTNNEHIKSQLVWSSTPNAVGNYSDVTVTLVYSRTNTGYVTSGHWTGSITIDGTETKGATKDEISIKYNSNTVAMTAKKRVYHESNGTKKIKISATGKVSSSSLTKTYCSGDIYLDEIDVSLPGFAGQPIVFNNVTQTSVGVSFTSKDDLDKIEYSLDGQKTWVVVNSKKFTISKLIPYTDYTLYVRIRKRSNQKTKTSSAWNFKTLPIYITDILVEDNVSVDVGNYTELEYSLVPQNASVKTLDIKSKNTDVVVVDGNRLLGLNKGQTTVTLTAKDGSGVSKTINVTNVQRVQGIVTNTPEVVLAKSLAIKLEYTILPNNADNKNVIVASSDDSVVSVVGNEILGVENGNATITITTEDGGFQAQIAVTVIGEYIWYDYSTPLEILNASDVENIKSNIRTIRSLLLSKGYEVEPLKEITARVNTPLNNMFDLLQNIEYNLDVISDNSAKSIYYVEPKVIGDYASNKSDIWRWLQILNEMYNILTGVFPKWQYLLCEDGYPTIDEKRILIRGDLIG